MLDEIKNVIASTDEKKLRQFGFTVGLFLIIVSLYFFLTEKTGGSYLAIIGFIFIISGWLIPVALKPIYIPWMSLAVIMGFIMTRLILSLLFLVIFVPSGLVLRVFKMDPLKEKIEPTAKSYWIKRKSKSSDPKSIENQY